MTQKRQIQTMKAARRRYKFYCRLSGGHVLENQDTGQLELWRTDLQAQTGIRWRHTIIAYTQPHTYLEQKA